MFIARALIALYIMHSLCHCGEKEIISSDGHLPHTYFFKEPNLEHDICDFETFQAECAADEVIIMENAEYGRMTAARCIAPFGLEGLGCSIDVMNIVDKQCSGKKFCQIKLPFEEIVRQKPCASGLRSYLLVKYSCLKVQAATRDQCYLPLTIAVDRDEIVLPSALLTQHGCEVLNLQAYDGQKIYISMVDFTRAIVEGQGECSVKYFEVVERRDGNDLHENICAGVKRDRSIYESNSNAIQILLDRRSIMQGSSFLVKVKVVLFPFSTGLPRYSYPTWFMETKKWRPANCWLSW